jgi:SAM-dependent methyltransferase
LERGSFLDLVKFTYERGIATFLQGAAVDYSRFLEYRLTYQRLALSPGLRLLDLGSGSTGFFPLWIVSRTDCTVHSTDVGDYVYGQLRHVEKLKLKKALAAGRLIIEQQDATALGYHDGSFDRVSVISTIEHIPDDGDTQACKEITRVLKAGGIVVISVPYNYELCAEVYMNAPELYGRKGPGLLWWQRVYNDQQLLDRIIEPSGLSLLTIDYFGEPTLPIGRYWYTTRSILRKGMGILTPLLSYLFLKVVEKEKIGMNAWLGSGAVITLLKGG